MPSIRKRIGYLPTINAQETIIKIAKKENLSQSKVVGILVEEALKARGIFDIKNSSIYLHLIDNSKNKTILNATFRIDNYVTKSNLSYRTYNWDTFSYDTYNDIKTSIKDDFFGISLNFIQIKNICSIQNISTIWYLK